MRKLNLSIKVPLVMAGIVLATILVIVTVQTIIAREVLQSNFEDKSIEAAHRYANEVSEYLNRGMDHARTLSHQFSDLTLMNQ